MAKMPPFLRSSRACQRILASFIKKLDHTPATARSRVPSQRFDEKSLPWCFDHSLEQGADAIWEGLLLLAEMEILELQPAKRKLKAHEPEYLGSRIVFCYGAELLVREWLDLPVKGEQLQQWRSIVENYAHSFSGDVERLWKTPIHLQEATFADVVQRLADLPNLIPSGREVTLRYLSARAFSGDSKFLDGREELVLQLHPELEKQLTQRPVHILVHLPPTYDAIVFIENQDCFDRAANGEYSPLTSCALVYLQGFKGTAQRLRTVQSAAFYYSSQSSASIHTRFEEFWFSESKVQPCYFWGDLDYSAAQMLKSLRELFPHMASWLPGYLPMLEALQRGEGHPLEASYHKGQQSHPGDTGCAMMDQKLVPSVEKYERVLDQEWVLLG